MMDEQPQLELDRIAEEMEARRDRWAERGFSMGELTWRDRARGWPWVLVPRGEATDPDSVGFRVRLGPAEGAVVVFRGGWADVELWAGDRREPEVDAPELPDTTSLGRLLDELLDRWPRAVQPPMP